MSGFREAPVRLVDLEDSLGKSGIALEGGGVLDEGNADTDAVEPVRRGR